MTASLYQSALSGSAGALSGIAAGTVRTLLGSRNTEHVRRKGLGVELDEIAPAAPRVVSGRYQVFQPVRTSGGAVEIDVAGLLHARVEVHRDQDQVVALLLRIADELVVVG